MTAPEVPHADLDAITARADAASPGDWSCIDENNGDGPERHWTVSNDVWAGNTCTPEGATPMHTDEWLTREDAEFIAHARQDVPALVAEVRRLRKALAAAEAEVQRHEEWENTAASHMHPTWDGEEPQNAILTNFIEHAAKLDNVIEDAREADGYTGNALTFVWDDDTLTLSAVSLALHDAEVKAQAVLDFAASYDSAASIGCEYVTRFADARAAAIREEASR